MTSYITCMFLLLATLVTTGVMVTITAMIAVIIHSLHQQICVAT